MAALAAAMSGASAGTVLATEELADELAKRFTGLSTKAVVERDFEASYETTARALILALQRCKHTLNAAFDTTTGAVLEAKKPVALLTGEFKMTIAITDRGAVTHLSGQAGHIGMDWGQNAKLLNELFDKTNEYLALFKS